MFTARILKSYSRLNLVAFAKFFPQSNQTHQITEWNYGFLQFGILLETCFDILIQCVAYSNFDYTMVWGNRRF